MKKRKQQNQKRKQKRWFQKSSISGLKSLARNSQKGYPRGKFEIMLLMSRKDLYQGKERCTHC